MIVVLCRTKINKYVTTDICPRRRLAHHSNKFIKLKSSLGIARGAADTMGTRGLSPNAYTYTRGQGDDKKQDSKGPSRSSCVGQEHLDEIGIMCRL
jgi:hypothetical protein